MKIAIAADHAGFEMKRVIAAELRSRGGTTWWTSAPTRPIGGLSRLRGEARQRGARGTRRARLLICGSGLGASIAANKLPGVRAGLCHDTYSAHQGSSTTTSTCW